MTRAILLFLLLLVLVGAAKSQSKGGFEQYHYFGSYQQYIYMPVVHFQSKRNWYTEARYNYEDLQTVSLYVGKTFTGTNRLSYTLTPLLGGAVGRFNGISTGVNFDMEFDKFYFSSQSQYSISTNHINPSFLYNWSELCYQSFSWMYTGLAVQQTHSQPAGSLLEPGLLVGFSFKNYTIPIYTFDPMKKERYFVVGINYQWGNNKAASKKAPTFVQSTSDLPKQ